MGKHERQEIKEAELIIVKILNSEKLSDTEQKNQWLRHALALAKKIKHDFPSIKYAEHLGNRYDNAGDIKVISQGKEFFIEIKMSDTKRGKGTKANISQNALTENYLFRGNPKSWSDFRKDKKHQNWVTNSLNQFFKYPDKILSIQNPAQQIEEKARHLRKLKKRKSSARNILNNIKERDKAEKIEYLNYLKQQKQDEKMIQKFYVLIMLGVHDMDVLKTLIKDDKTFYNVENLVVYYSNVIHREISVKRENIGVNLSKILRRFSRLKIVFIKDSTSCKIVGIGKDSVMPLLRISLHWKNIAQGIKTPCLNIFEE